MNINSLSFDIRDLESPINTSYAFVEEFFRALSTKIFGEKHQLRSSSLYYHRHLSHSPDESVLEERRKSLSSFVDGSSRVLKSNLILDGLSLIDCQTEGGEFSSAQWDGTSSILQAASVVGEGEEEIQNDLNSHLHEPYPLEEPSSAFYILERGAGHFALHLRPFLRSVSVDVLCSSCSLDFVGICEVLQLAFGVSDKSNVKAFTSVRK